MFMWLFLSGFALDPSKPFIIYRRWKINREENYQWWGTCQVLNALTILTCPSDLDIFLTESRLLYWDWESKSLLNFNISQISSQNEKAILSDLNSVFLSTTSDLPYRGGLGHIAWSKARRAHFGGDWDQELGLYPEVGQEPGQPLVLQGTCFYHAEPNT